MEARKKLCGKVVNPALPRHGEKYQPIYHSANIEFVKKFDELLAKNNCEEILIHYPSKRNAIEVLSENESRFFSTIFSLPPFEKKIHLPRCIYIGEDAYESLKYPSYVTNSNIRFNIHLLPVISKIPAENIISFHGGELYIF